MNRPHLQRNLLYAVFLIVFSTDISAQQLRVFNQNPSRSNHTRAFNQNSSRSNKSGLSIAFTPTYSNAINSNSDSLLFRGSGTGFRFTADYFLGKAGISFSSGFSSSAPDNTVINNFLKRVPVPQDQLQITKARQQNMYLLLGPSIRLGNVVEFYAHAKGGLFINNSGLVNIQQKGAQRAAYRNESTGKSVYPGFFTGLGVQYNTKSDTWSFGIGADYMNTRSEVNNFDARRGIEGLKLSRNITDIVTGITIRYNIFSPRDAQSGQSTGKREFGISEPGDKTNLRVLPTVNKREITTSREAGSGMATGRRVLPTVNKREIAIDESGVHLMANQSCGPVTMKTTNTDGSITETTFSCPDDAAAFIVNSHGIPQTDLARTSNNNPDQLKRTFPAPHVLEGKGIISGRLSWPSAASSGIVTNTTMGNTRQTQQSSFGTLVRISAREAGSGMATGKRSREAGSGMATGRRQYQPIYVENGGTVCNPCLADAKLSSVNSNPLYEDKGTKGNNPMYESNKRTTTDDDNDGLGDIDVYLIEAESGAVVSKTRTAASGNFFFANVPDGIYIVRVSGSFTGRKEYNVSLKSKTDLLSSVEQSNEPLLLSLNTDGDSDEMAQKAGVSTSRSNIRTKSIAIIDADLDGDGEPETLKTIATQEDGSSQDISDATSAQNTSGTRGIILGKEGMRVTNTRRANTQIGKNNNLSSIAIKNSADKLTATGTFSNGSTRDITESLVINTNHDGIKQYNITVADLDDDGIADAVIKTKTKSNQSNDRVATGDVDGDGLIWSPRSNIKMINVAAGDVNGDGVSEMVAAPFVPGGSVISAAREGDPIHGVDVKLGMAGKAIKATSSNEYGEVEFDNLQAGDYTLIVQQDIFIDDETIVAVGNQTKAQDHNSSRSNKTASTIDDSDNSGGGTKVQDHNSSRSNKTASVITSDPNNDTNLILKAQNNNTVRSNRSDNALINNNDPDNITIDEGGLSKPQGNVTKANIGPVKWMAPESLRKSINTSESNLKEMLSLLDALDEQLNTDEMNQRSGINTSRSNIKNQRAAVNKLIQALDELQMKEKNEAINDLEQKRNEADLQFLKLQQSVKQLGAQYSSISNVLKTRHEAAMNSIRNMK